MSDFFTHDNSGLRLNSSWLHKMSKHNSTIQKSMKPQTIIQQWPEQWQFNKNQIIRYTYVYRFTYIHKEPMYIGILSLQRHYII